MFDPIGLRKNGEVGAYVLVRLTLSQVSPSSEPVELYMPFCLPCDWHGVGSLVSAI
jgi:hypothetical protein